MFCTPPGIHCLVLHTLTAMDLDGGAGFLVYSLVLDVVLTFGIHGKYHDSDSCVPKSENEDIFYKVKSVKKGLR